MWNELRIGLGIQEQLDLGFISIQCSASKEEKKMKEFSPEEKKDICIDIKNLKEFKFCFICVLNIFFMPLL